MTAASTKVAHLDLEAAELDIGCRFRNRDLLKLALVHSSFFNEHPNEVPASNERLEYLGDSLLDLVVAEELYRFRPGAHEGELTALRAELVRGEALAQLGNELSLGRHLLLGQGEEATGGRKRPSNLAGAFESLLAALFLDQGYSAAREYVLRILGPELKRYSNQGTPKDPKSQLQELLQAQGKPSPKYRTVAEYGPHHAKRFVVEVFIGDEILGCGRGERKSEASREAAHAALERITGGA